VSEEIVCGLRKGNDFSHLILFKDMPLNRFSARMQAYSKNNTQAT